MLTVSQYALVKPPYHDTVCYNATLLQVDAVNGKKNNKKTQNCICSRESRVSVWVGAWEFRVVGLPAPKEKPPKKPGMMCEFCFRVNIYFNESSPGGTK